MKRGKKDEDGRRKGGQEEDQGAQIQQRVPLGALALLPSVDIKNGGNRKLVSVSRYFPGRLFVGASTHSGKPNWLC